VDPVTKARELARRYFDGLLSPVEIDELQRVLQSSPEAADAFAQISRLESDLGELFAHEQAVRGEGEILDAITRQQRRRRWLGRTVRIAVAACVLLAVLGPLLAWLAWQGESGSSRTGVEIVGTLDQRDGVARVTSSEARLRLPDGSRVRLEQGSEFVVPSADTGRLVELLAGKGHFEVSKADVDFRVETPAGRVTALGTEFSVTLTHEREEEFMKLSHVVLAVVVASGLVQVEAGGEWCVLEGGQSRVFGQDRQREENQRDERKREERRPALKTQRGVILEVGEKKLTLVSRENRDGIDVDVPESAKVFVDGKEAKFSDLAKEMFIVIEKNDKDAVVAIRAEGPTIAAVVKSATKDKITIKIRNERRAEDVEHEYAIAKDVRIAIDGKAGAATDLKEGDTVALTLSANKKTVRVIVKGRGRERRGDNSTGAVIASIAAKENKLTIKGERENREVTLAKDVKVTIDGKESKLADLKEGDRVALVFDRQSREVTQITKGGREGGERRARENQVVGIVKGTEKTDNTITLADEGDNDERVFSLAKDVKVTIDGKESKLEDVKEKARVLLTLGRDSKTVVAIAIGNGRGREGGERARVPTVVGKVAKAPKDNTLTLTIGRGNEEKDFAVAKDAKVTIEGKASKLEDVKEGMVVTLVLDAEQKTVKEVTVAPTRRRERE
jgi:ferric-dicitrate binding protein FerR (iron transport regulator)